MSTTYGPIFCNRNNYYWWTEYNCDRCKKSVINNVDASIDGMALCEIERAIIASTNTDGMVSEDIATRMGFLLPDGTPRTTELYWDCTEREDLEGEK